MFCGSTQAVDAVTFGTPLKIPDGGVIQIFQYDFNATYGGCTMLRVGLLQLPPSHNKPPTKEGWAKVATDVLSWQVRILGCPAIRSGDHPLITAFSSLIQTSHIMPSGRANEFPICVFGDVSEWYGEPRKVHNKVLGCQYMNFPQMYGVTVKTPKVIIENTMKGIIALHGWGLNPPWSKTKRKVRLAKKKRRT